MTNVPKRLMNVPPNSTHAAGGSVRKLSRSRLNRNDSERSDESSDARGEASCAAPHSIEFEAEPHPQVRQDRAGERTGAVPDDVIDVGDAVRQKVLAGLDEARERQAAEDREDVRLDRRTVDGVERDEQK